MLKGIPCHHDGCSHVAQNNGGHLMHGALHFTASVMGNPEYLAAVKNLAQATDERVVGIERVNAFHAASHEKMTIRRLAPWKSK